MNGNPITLSLTISYSRKSKPLKKVFKLCFKIKLEHVFIIRVSINIIIIDPPPHRRRELLHDNNNDG